MHFLQSGLVLSTTVLLVAGCESTGLSVREAPGRDYAADALALGRQTTASAPARPVLLPMKMAVAQIGEVAPPSRMLETLRKDTSFTVVTPVPCSTGTIEEIAAYARNLGADYLFVFGGTIDHSDGDTFLAVANLTIVGAFIVPSKQLDAEGRAVGSLIDLSTNRVAAAVSADGQEHELVPAASTEVSQVHLLTKIRDSLADQLTQQLISQVKTVAAVKVVADSKPMQ